MHLGVMIFATDFSIRMDELAVEVEDRGFESLFVPEHTHIPTNRESPWPGGNDLPREYWHAYDPFVSLSFARGEDQEPQNRDRYLSASSTRHDHYGQAGC